MTTVMTGIDSRARPETPDAPPWRVFLLAWALLTALSAMWSIATPLSASPDEPAHLVKAASVVRGEWVGETSGRGQLVDVPTYVAFSHLQTCYAFRDDRTADCIMPTPENSGEITESFTTAGLYNPLYYLAVGWPSLLFGDESGIYAMRLMSALLCSALAAGAFALIRQLRARILPTVAYALAITPMTLFLFGSVNPNGFEAAAVVLLFSAMLVLVFEPRRERIGWIAALLAIGVVAAANARGVSLLWVAVAVLLPLILIRWSDLWALVRRPVMIATIAISALGAALALVWVVMSNSLGTRAVDAGTGFQYPGTGMPFSYGFLRVLEGSFAYSEGIVGIFGWLDTPAPSAVYFVWAGLCASLLLGALVVLRGRRLIFVLGLVTAFLVLPAVLQGFFITDGGLIWQGRYNLPLYLCVVIGTAAAAAWALDRLDATTKTRLIRIVLAAVAFGQVYSFATAIRRYSVGIDGSWRTTFIDPPWQAPGGNITLVVLFAAICCVSAWLIARVTTRQTTMSRQPISE